MNIITILTEKIETRWNGKNKKHYEDLGYIYTKHNDTFVVNIEHLHVGSNQYVDVCCDYCKTNKKIIFNQYNDSLNRGNIKKYSCNSCKQKKQKEEAEFLQSKGLLPKENAFYYYFKENIEKEIIEYINVYGTVDNLTNLNKKLYTAIYKHDERSLFDILNELGYRWEDYSSRTPDNYYNDFKNVKNKVEEFVLGHNRFPTTKEMSRELNIQLTHIKFHGGIDTIKAK